MLTSYDYVYLFGGLVGVISLMVALCDAFPASIRIGVPIFLVVAFALVGYYVLGDSPRPPDAVFPISLPWWGR